MFNYCLESCFFSCFLIVVLFYILYDWCVIAMQEVDLNQMPAERKLSAGNISPAALANGNKQSNGYESPRIGRRSVMLFSQLMYTLV